MSSQKMHSRSFWRQLVAEWSAVAGWRWDLPHEKRPRERRSKPMLLPVVVSAVPTDAPLAILELRVGREAAALSDGPDGLPAPGCTK